MEYDEFSAMNTTVLCAAESRAGGDTRQASAGFAVVREYVAECEARFSRFLPDSELCRLNRAAGQWFLASDDLYELVETALELHERTGDLFDPSILPVLQQAGYDRSMEEIRRTGDQPAGRQPLAGAASTALFTQTGLDSARRAIRLPEGVQIDLGGLAKGWIVERAARRLATYSPACAVEAGGDMFLCGLPGEFDDDEVGWPQPASPWSGQYRKPGWRVALEDPRDPQNTLAMLRAGPGALVTSSVTRRRWTQGGQLRHHIIDPRTSQPAEPAWLSVTVFAYKATWAEAFAKAILLAGPQEALRLARQVPELRFIVVNPDGSLGGAPESMELIDVPEPIR